MATRVRTPAPLMVAAAGCVAIALASLLLAAGPTYDPYAWLIWGREIGHLDLVTTGAGSSWKPLPPLIDAVLAPLGGAAPAAWLVVARAGALFAVLMAFRLAWRLARPGRRVLAGVVAAASLVLTHDWVHSNGVGLAEGLMTALALLAIDRHLDGRRGQAFWLLVAAGLIRVEVWPFLFAYALWLCFARERPRRPVLLAGALLIPLLWFGGDWVGSGTLTASAGRALERTPGIAGLGSDPALGVLREAYHILPLPAWIGAAAALVLGVARERILLAIAGGAAAWTALVAIMAEHGYAGLPRFLFIASALEAVLAGVGAAAIVAAAAAVVSRARLPRPHGVAVAAVVAGFALAAAPDVARLPDDAAYIGRVAHKDAHLTAAVDRVGGAGAIFRCGRPATSWFMVTTLAWDLGVDSTRVDDRRLVSRPIEFVPHQDGWTVRRHCRGQVSSAMQPAPPR